MDRKEYFRRYHKEYYLAKVKDNPEKKAKRAEYHAKWQSENKDKWNAYRRKYRKRKKGETI